MGYVLKLTDDLWVPLDINGQTISGPTHKSDAQNIVLMRKGLPVD
jgi:hypothetical protein